MLTSIITAKSMSLCSNSGTNLTLPLLSTTGATCSQNLLFSCTNNKIGQVVWARDLSSRFIGIDQSRICVCLTDCLNIRASSNENYGIIQTVGIPELGNSLLKHRKKGDSKLLRRNTVAVFCTHVYWMQNWNSQIWLERPSQLTDALSAGVPKSKQCGQLGGIEPF